MSGTNMSYESNIYKKMVIQDVNNYIGEYEIGGFKYKGLFEIDKELHKDPSMRIVPIALNKYFFEGISIKDTIINHKNIYDFCLRLKVNKGWQAQYKYISEGKLQTTILSKNTRYYVSNHGGALYKYNLDDKRVIGVNVNYITTTFNNFKKEDNYDINYNFYINECKKIIDSIEDKQLELFK